MSGRFMPPPHVHFRGWVYDLVATVTPDTTTTPADEPVTKESIVSDNVDLGMSCFSHVAKSEGEESAGRASTRAIHELAPEMEQRMRAARPLSRVTDEIVRREVRKSDKGALYAYLETNPALSGLPLRDALQQMDPDVLTLLLRRMAVPGVRVAKAAEPRGYQARLTKGRDEDYEAFKARVIAARREGGQ